MMGDKSGMESPTKAAKDQRATPLLNPIETKNIQDCITYLFNTLVNLSAFSKSLKELDCDELLQKIVKQYNNNLNKESQITLINIMFNLNFDIKEAP
jgi:hypothetical protein